MTRPSATGFTMVQLATYGTARATSHPVTGNVDGRVGAPLTYSDKYMSNLTPFDMTLASAYQQPGLYGREWFNGEYPTGGPTRTGQQNRWGITDWGFGDNNQWTVAYNFTDDQGAVMTATAAYVPNQQYPNLSATTCAVTGNDAGNYQCDVDANNGVSTVHPNTSALNLSQQDRNAFAHGLENLCSTGNYSCAFAPTEQPTWSQSAAYIPQSEHAIIGCKADGQHPEQGRPVTQGWIPSSRACPRDRG